MNEDDMSNWLGVRHCLLMYLDMRRWVKYQNSIVSVAGSHRLVLIFVLATVVPSSLGTTKFGKCTIYFPVGMLVSTTHECESNKDLITSLLTCTHSTSIMELSLHPYHAPGDSSRDPTCSPSSRSLNPWKGHVSTIPERSPAELPGGCFCVINNVTCLLNPLVDSHIPNR